MITLIRAYQRVISPLLPRRCKYHPDVLGLRRAGDRVLRHTARLRARSLALLRCNPFSHGGYDPVSAQTLFTASHSQPS